MPVNSKDASPEYVYCICNKIGHQYGTSSLDLDIIEKGSTLVNFHSLEEALNTTYTPTFREKHFLNTTRTNPQPLSVAHDTCLIVTINSLRIVEVRSKWATLLEDLLNPIERGRLKAHRISIHHLDQTIGK